MEIVYRDPRDLVPLEKNPRRHPASQIAKIINAIKEFGFAKPVRIIEHEGKHLIVAGHGAVEAALKIVARSIRDKIEILQSLGEVRKEPLKISSKVELKGKMDGKIVELLKEYAKVIEKIADRHSQG